MDKYIFELDSVFDDYDLFIKEATIEESSSSIIDKINAFYSNIYNTINTKRLKAEAIFITSTMTANDMNDKKEVGSYTDRLNANLEKLKKIADSGVRNVTVHNYSKMYSEFEKYSNTLSDDALYIINKTYTNRDDILKDMKDFTSKKDKYDKILENMKDDTEFLNVTTAGAILRRSNTIRPYITRSFDNLTKTVLKIESAANKIAADPEKDELMKTYLLVYRTISNALLSFTSKWCNFMRSNLLIEFTTIEI